MSAVLTSTITVAGRAVVRRDRDWTHLVDQLQAMATAVVADVFPERGLKRFSVFAWFRFDGLCRARRGINCPIGRILTWFAGMAAVGFGRSEAQRLVELLQDGIELVWPIADVDPVDVLVLEQDAESEENPLQARYLSGDRSVRPQLIAALRRERARQSTAIARLEAEEAAERRLARAGGAR